MFKKTGIGQIVDVDKLQSVLDTDEAQKFAEELIEEPEEETEDESES